MIGVEEHLEIVTVDGAVVHHEIEDVRGADHPGESEAANGAVVLGEIESIRGAVPLDLLHLSILTATWEDLSGTRKAAAQRGLEDEFVAAIRKLEERAGRQVGAALRSHPIWPWLSRFPGLGGVHTARLIVRIGDPHRFPGQQCSLGHTFPVGLPIGASCTAIGKDDRPCPGDMQEPRRGTGVRSLWHYCGLHVVDGRSPRKTKGQRVSWDPVARTAVLQPDGIADHIVRQRVPVYREVYDTTKTRLIRERGAVDDDAIVLDVGPAVTPNAIEEDHGGADVHVVIEQPRGPAVAASAIEHRDGGADTRAEIEVAIGLRPFQIDALARKVAAKAFVGDLLIALKAASSRSVGESGIDVGHGPGEAIR